MKVRRITSLTALISFCLLVLTSVVLYIVPQGRVAYWADWRLWGLSKTQWGDIHINLGLLFLLAIFLHIYYNWKPILNYLKNRAKQLKLFTPEFNVALLLTAIFTIGTLFYVPPFNWVLILGDHFKASAEAKYGAPPYGHAELSSLKSFASRTGLNLEESMARIKKEGLRFEGPSQTLKDIAQANQMSPQQVFEIMKTNDEPRKSAAMPASPPQGIGKRSIAAICKTYDRDLATVLNTLKDRTIKVVGDQTLKEVAQINQLDPEDIYEMIRESQ